MKDGPKIFIVATPLGNLGDLSPRAREVLSSVDCIACEDTRVTKKLLQSCGIKVPQLVSYYEQIEEKRADELVERVKKEELSLALLSDAGTPCIADPGYRLVKRARDLAISVVPVPGPSALATLVSASGLPSDRLLFVGFLPRKKQSLVREIQSWQNSNASIVAFETAKRLPASLEVLIENLRGARICMGREMTKMFEEIHTCSLSEALEWAKGHTPLKGELSLMIALGEKTVSSDLSPLLEKAKFLHKKGLSHRDIMEFFGDLDIDYKLFYRELLKALT